MTKTPVAETIISLLEKGSVARKEVIEKTQKLNSVTMQAVYKELKSLVSSGKVLSHKDALSLNLLYISKQYDKWSSVLNHYEGGQNLKNHFLDLQEDEHITLKFKTLNAMDAYWVHASVILDKNTKQNGSKQPLSSYSIIPHDWFAYGRKETDIFWTKTQKEKMRIVITGSTALDKEMARKRIKVGYKISASINPLKQKDTVYYTLINGYIFKITLDNKIQRLLTNFIEETESFDKIDYERIHKIINTPCSCVMKISKNQNKFTKMSAKCSKYFSEISRRK
jgi:hypothetical protein